MAVRFPKSQVGRHVMIAILQFATLVITTMFAAAAAAGLHWLFLQAAFLMMRPATAPRIPVRTELVRRTAQLARAFSAPRGTRLGWKGQAPALPRPPTGHG